MSRETEWHWGIKRVPTGDVVDLENGKAYSVLYNTSITNSQQYSEYTSIKGGN